MNGVKKEEVVEVIDIDDDVQASVAPNAGQNVKSDSLITPVASGLQGVDFQPPPFRVHDKVYGLERSLKDPWREAYIEEIYKHFGKTVVRLKFTHSEKGVQRKKYLRVVNSNHIAYFEPLEGEKQIQIPVGCRVIARTLGRSSTGTLFFAGIVAEPPKHLNKHRYLIFFDDGYAAYCRPENIRLVSCSNSFAAQAWADVHPDSQKFVKEYFTKYPDNRRVTVREQSLLTIEWNGLWWTARVIKVDCSLLKVRLIASGLCILIWRGSNRLLEIYKEQNSTRSIPLWVQTHEEYEGKIVRHQVPSKHLKTLKYDSSHKCNRSCSSTFTGNDSELRRMSPLVVPFYHGWKRGILYDKPGRPVYYETPCGKKLWNEDEVQSFITKTNCILGINLFNYTFLLKCLDEFEVFHQGKPGHYYCEDISGGQEWVPISKINTFNTDQPPYIAYTTQRVPGRGVFVNTNDKFLVCCDCTDNCEDKKKCACFRLTFENDPDFGTGSFNDLQRGYQNRRLFEKYLSGIYECNQRCKCRSTCINRVVQNGLQWRLQVFYTSSKGYAIRTLQDIPEGSFICVYTGELLSSAQANEDGSQFGDEYLANLDFIETAEMYKEGYEEAVVEPKPVASVARRSGVRQKGVAGKKSKKTNVKRGKKGKNQPKSNNKENNKKAGRPKRSSVKRKRYNEDNSDENSEVEEVAPMGTSVTRKYYGADQDKDIFAIDAKCIGNVGRYLNHSCNPNVFAQDVFLDTQDIRFPWVAFFAMRYIQCGSELTWDYNYQVGMAEGKCVPCNCGSVTCRKRLL